MENKIKSWKVKDEYAYNCTRIGFTELDIKAWNEGSGNELKKWLGVGMFKTKIIFNDGSIAFYNNTEECDKLDKALNKGLTEELFHRMCDRYFELIDESENAKSKEEVYKITVKCWPIWIVFDILDNYPYFGSDTMLRRIMRIRTKHQDFYYKLSKRLNIE